MPTRHLYLDLVERRGEDDELGMVYDFQFLTTAEAKANAERGLWFKVGDIVRSIDGRPVGSILEFYRAVNKTNPNELMLTVSRQGQDFRVGLVR